MGEYLATANPVIITKVGEITKYLEDGKNSFIAEPDSIEAIEKKLLEIFNDYKKAIKVGKEGRKTVENIFNSEIQGKRIETFINNLT